jgi:hypothetical protein
MGSNERSREELFLATVGSEVLIKKGLSTQIDSSGTDA